MTRLITVIVPDSQIGRDIINSTGYKYEIYKAETVSYDINLAKWYISVSKKSISPDGKVECPTCDGTKKAYDPMDNDSYEGYKLASKKTCYECKGTGVVDLSFYSGAYKLHLEREKEEAELKKKASELLKHYSIADINFIIDNSNLFKLQDNPHK